MTIDVTLTSYVLNPWDGTYSSTNKIALSYADLDFTPSASDSYKSTSGDVFKVYVGGIRIYRTDDKNYASGSGFLEDGDSTDGTKLNGLTGNISTSPATAVGWDTATSNNVWTIDTANQKIFIDTNAITTSALYGTHGKNISFTSGSTIISLTRAVQDLKTPAIDFSNASILTEQDLDNSAKNVFHAAQQAVISTENAMLYSSGTDTYSANQPGTANPKRISSVATPTNDNDAANKAYVDGGSDVQTVAGLSSELALLGTPAMATATTGHIPVLAESTYKAKVETVAGTDYKAKVEAVAGKETEIERLGTTDAVADLAALGDTAFSHATTGHLKKVSDKATEVAAVAAIDTEVGVVGESVYKGKVETVAGATYKGQIETVAGSTYKGQIETVANSTYKGQIETVAESTYKGKVETVAGDTTAINSIHTNISQVTTFADTYHTAGTTEPSGSNVTEGDLWFDTANDVLKVYDGSSWGSASSSIATVASQNEFSASDGQGTDNKYFALAHDVGLELVFLNGVRLKRGDDYYCTNSNTSTTAITSGNAATFVRLETVPSTNDILSVMAFGQIANNLAVNIAGGTFTGAVTFEGQNTHNTGDNTFTIPTTRGTDGYVLTRDDTAGTGGTTWKETLQGPTITGIKYSNQTSGTFVENSGQTATGANASSGEEDLVQLTGSNFDSTLGGNSSNVGISIDGTSATSISVNSAKTEVTFKPPAKSAGSYTLTATNGSGLNATTTISYDADPTWVTASAPSSSLGNFVESGSAITGTNGPQIVASESGSNLTTGYKRVTSDTDNTVITTAIAGLTLGDNGYLIGTLAGTDGATNTFYAVAHDNENQQSAIRQFHFISYDYVGSGGTVVEPASYTGDYRSHTFFNAGNGSTTNTFTLLSATTIDVLLIGGGGGTHKSDRTGGGGAGAFVELSSQSWPAGTYTMTVGVGGNNTTTSDSANRGGETSIVYSGSGSFTNLYALGGASGGTTSSSGLDGDSVLDETGPTKYGSSGGGGGAYVSTQTDGGTASTGVTFAFRNDGGQASGGSGNDRIGGGGGGAGGAASTKTGGAGKSNNWRDGSSGTTEGFHIFAGGGGGGAYSSTQGTGGSGGGGDGGKQSVASQQGTDGTGSGGGGGGETAQIPARGGGHGVIILLYAI